ncbi:hypothetical protein EI94DRAFT_1782499 [Lactarius quietus]|nr:hypothetical protein EI94DRAFT_1782499 [Lactarius quietus]
MYATPPWRRRPTCGALVAHHCNHPMLYLVLGSWARSAIVNLYCGSSSICAVDEADPQSGRAPRMYISSLPRNGSVQILVRNRVPTFQCYFNAQTSSLENKNGDVA